MSYQNKLVGVLILCLLPYFLLFAYCHPSGDDFSYAILGSKQGLFPALIDEYNLWNGRYFSNVFVLKNPLIFRNSWLSIYRISLLGIFLSTIISFFCFLNYFFKKVLIRRTILLITLLIILLNLFQMPVLSEGTYWYTGVVTYQLANCFTLFYFIGLHHFSNCKKGLSKTLLFILLFCSILLLAGFNEVEMLFLVALHVLIVVIQWRYKLANRTWFFGFLIASLIGFCLVYFAPGNKVREAYFIGESHRLGYSVLQTFLQMLRFSFDWTFNGVLILLSYIYLSFSQFVVFFSNLLRNHFFVNRWIAFITLIGVLFLAIFPAYWSTGIMGQHRTVNMAYFYFIMLWFINLTVWSDVLINTKIFGNVQIKKIALIVSILCIGFSNNSFTAWKDLISNDAKNFNKQLNNRYLLLDSMDKHMDKIQTIPVLNIKPKSIFIYDLSNDPKYFPNTCYKTYWDLNSYLIGK